MSEATKKKHVTREVLEDFPEPIKDQFIVRIFGPRGNNLHEVERVDGTRFLCSMPTKFRKNVWIKRGGFVIVEPIEEGDKVKAEIVHILFSEQIRHLQKQGLWPKEFIEGDVKQEDALEGIDDDISSNESEEDVEEEVDEYGNSRAKDDEDDDDDDS